MNEENDLIKDMIAESGLDAAEYADVAEALAALRGLAPSEPPAPSTELAALLSGGVVTPLPVGRSRKRRIVLASGAVAATLVLGTGIAAASNNLPAGAQKFANDFSKKHLPFTFPSPDERGDESSPGDSGNGPKKPAKTDNGKQVGQGTGAGETDNPGIHNGSKTEPGKPDQTDQPNNGQSPGQGQGNNNAGGNGNADPDKSAKTPRAKPSEPPGQGGENNGKKPPPKDTGNASSDRGSSADAGGTAKGKATG
jgi:hypothetical protein